MATTIKTSLSAPFAKKRITVFTATIAFLFFYMIAFPKGGIKAAGIPLTVGYAFTPLLALLALARSRGFSIPVDRLIAAIPGLLLTLWSAIVMHINGADKTGSVISYFINVTYLPIFGLLTFSSLLFDEHRTLIEKVFLWAVRFIVAYGIFLFFFKEITGKWIEIPYVTVNAADVGQLDDKYINRGGIFKLISTYNNGNIFGVCLLTMAPLYLLLEKRKMMSGLVYFSLLLTLSRTAWIGMVLLYILRSLSKGLKLTTVLYVVFGSILALFMLYGILSFMDRGVSFIFNSSLGGREVQLNVLNNIRIVPNQVFTAIPEIAYLGMLNFFGIPGILLFTLFLGVSPVLMRLEGVRLIGVGPASACVQGLVIYMILAGADAAFELIPVMMVFWMVAGMGFWYAHHQAKLQRMRLAVAG